MRTRKSLALILAIPTTLALVFGACAIQPSSSTATPNSATKTAAAGGPTATVGNTSQPTPTTAPPAANPTATATLPPLPPPVVATAVEFTWRANASNSVGDYTVIDNPYTNGNPHAIILVTHNWNPGGVGGVYNNHPSGVYYTNSKWAIFNEDKTTMVVNSTYNVRVIINTGSTSACVNGPGGNTIAGDGQTLSCGVGSSPSTSTAVYATLNWNSPGTGVYINSPLGVYHNLVSPPTMLIFRQDQATWPSGATINTSTNGGNTNLIVTTTSLSRDPVNSNSVIINSAACNGNPNALLQVTQNWNPGASSGTYNDHNIGVWYNSSNSRWEVYNEDGSALPTNAAFNVGVN